MVLVDQQQFAAFSLQVIYHQMAYFALGAMSADTPNLQ